MNTDRSPVTAPALSLIDLASNEPSATAAAYRQLLGHSLRRPTPEATDPADDARTDIAVVDAVNATIRIRHGESGDHRAMFAAPDPEAHVRLLRRRGLALDGPVDGEWYSDTAPFGVASSSTAPTASTGLDSSEHPEANDIIGIDHVVFQGADRDQCVALFGATLGLDFRLDREVNPDLRQLFFRTGDFVVEVVIPTAASLNDPVSLWGIAWRSRDIEATRTRLSVAA